MTTPTPEQWAGVHCLIDCYARAQPGDFVVVTYTAESRTVAAWVLAALEARRIETRSVPMLPLQDEGFVERLQPCLPQPDSLKRRLVVVTLEVETMSHSVQLREALSRYPVKDCVLLRLMSSVPELFGGPLRARPDDLAARNTTILRHFMAARTLTVTSRAGTHLEVELDNDKYRWISNHGVWRPGQSLVLPAGEVATFPASIRGVLVADAAFNVNKTTNQDARLDLHPVVVEIEDSRAVRYTCGDEAVRRLLEDCLSRENGNRVGELGFGTNFAVNATVPSNSHINERIPGVHLGFGQHNQGAGVTYYCPTHLDLIAYGAAVWCDDEADCIDLEDLQASAEGHPLSCQGEDAFSPDDVRPDDCCGLLGCELPSVGDRVW